MADQPMRPTLDDETERAITSLDDARQIVRALPDLDRDYRERLEALLLQVSVELVRLGRYAQRVELTNTGLNETLIGANNRLAAASRDVEQLLIKASIGSQQAAEHFNAIRGLRDTLDPSVSIIGDGGGYVIITREPATAVAGG